MKTTDNMYDTPYGKKRESLIIEALNAHSVLPEIRAQRDALQTELGNTQFALEEMAAQRDAAVAALRDLRNRIVAEKPDCINTTKADTVLAAAESEAQ